MNRLLNILSYITILLAVVGFVFKLHHWPGAGPMLIFSLGFLSLFFFPAYIVYRIKEAKERGQKTMNIIGFTCIAIFNLGTLFKIMHWPVANTLLIFSVVLFAFGFIPVYVVYHFKKSNGSKEKMMYLFSGFYLGLLSLGLLFKLMHWPASVEIMIAGCAFMFLGYLPLFFSLRKSNPDFTKKLANYCFIVIVIVCLIRVSTNNSNNVFLNTFSLSEEIMNGITANLNYKIESLASTDATDINTKNKINKVKELSDELNNYIQHLRSYLIMNSDGTSKEWADSVSLYEVYAKDNMDVPTKILIGGDAESPREGTFSARELKNKITVYREDILGMFEGDERKIMEKITGLNTSPMMNRNESRMIDWEVNVFYNVPLAGVINILSQLQNNIRLAESEIISRLQNQSGVTKENVK